MASPGTPSQHGQPDRDRPHPNVLPGLGRPMGNHTGRAVARPLHVEEVLPDPGPACCDFDPDDCPAISEQLRRPRRMERRGSSARDRAVGLPRRAARRTGRHRPTGRSGIATHPGRAEPQRGNCVGAGAEPRFCQRMSRSSPRRMALCLTRTNASELRRRGSWGRSTFWWESATTPVGASTDCSASNGDSRQNSSSPNARLRWPRRGSRRSNCRVRGGSRDHCVG